MTGNEEIHPSPDVLFVSPSVLGNARLNLSARTRKSSTRNRFSMVKSSFLWVKQIDGESSSMMQ